MEPERTPPDQPDPNRDPEREAALAEALDEDNAAADWTPPRPWMRSFLIAYAGSGNITRACERVGISDESVRTWRQRDEQFAVAFARAADRAHDYLEEVARAWATVGLEERTVETKTLDNGDVIITEKVSRTRSPTLMRTLLEATGREKFRRNMRVEQTGAGGGPVQHEHTVVDETVKLFREELERLGPTPEEDAVQSEP